MNKIAGIAPIFISFADTGKGARSTKKKVKGISTVNKGVEGSFYLRTMVPEGCQEYGVL